MKEKESGAKYVIKIMEMSPGIMEEARLLSKFQSPHLVKYKESFVHEDKAHIVMELCERGDLDAYLKKQKGALLPESKIWKFFIELCLGLQYLHANRVLHRDVKALNIFIDA